MKNILEKSPPDSDEVAADGRKVATLSPQPQKRLPQKLDAAPAPAKMDSLESLSKNNFID
jgi:hypothetical protein